MLFYFMFLCFIMLFLVLLIVAPAGSTLNTLWMLSLLYRQVVVGWFCWCSTQQTTSLSTQHSDLHPDKFKLPKAKLRCSLASIQLNVSSVVLFTALSSVQFSSVQFSSIQFNSIQFNSIHDPKEINSSICCCAIV